MRAVLSQVVPFELGEVIGMPRVNGCRYRIRVAPLTMTLWTDDVVSLVSVSGGYQALCCRYGQVCVGWESSNESGGRWFYMLTVGLFTFTCHNG